MIPSGFNDRFYISYTWINLGTAIGSDKSGQWCCAGRRSAHPHFATGQEPDDGRRPSAVGIALGNPRVHGTDRA